MQFCILPWYHFLTTDAFGLTPPTTKTPCNCTHLHTWLPCSVHLVCGDIDLSWHHQPQSHCKYYTTTLLFFWTWYDATAPSVDASDLKMQRGRRGNLDSACCVSFQFHYLSPSRLMNIYEYLYLYWFVYNEKSSRECVMCNVITNRTNKGKPSNIN